jgi:putative intracellular protease/amidase
MRVVLMPLPSRDFDPTEVAVSWKVLVAAGYTVRFATPDGAAADADDRMIIGEGLDPLGVCFRAALPRRVRARTSGRQRRSRGLRPTDCRAAVHLPDALGRH